MLRNRSKAMTGKQALMADHGPKSPFTQNSTKPSFFGSPRFQGFTFKSSLPESDPVIISPTSILEPFSPKSPFYSNKLPTHVPQNKHSWQKLDSKGIGVALIGDEDENPSEKNIISSFSKPSNKMMLFGTKLRVQIPPPANNLTADSSPKSPADFGTKTRNSQFSRYGFEHSGNQSLNSPQVFSGCVSMSELELSEDYTCVISHGPNPKTTHIYDNCVLENCCSNLSDKSFLVFCHTCKKKLEQKNDIFVYRGEKGFCSQECRYREMLLDGNESGDLI